ncbi:PREDICTED: CWF19-like protein 2 [Acropora digitifera]|uniref:CWF19-like protein 2 n=1 Tax=Acropora digitifera TaxID=70779 RepID=UPI00077A50B6|nr:PREDICTED: CWF19-like protein 2 [Acropora digitifera]
MSTYTTYLSKFKMADLINFVSKREIDAKKEQRRRGRQEILRKAKEDYERKQREKELRKESGETTWMLPALSKRLSEETESREKRKKHKKDKKQKKSNKEPGQHPKELNPYWRDGGTGLPSQLEDAQDTTIAEGSSKSSYSCNWLKKAYQRAKEHAQEEGRSLEEILAQRYGSLEKLESMIKEAEQRERGYRSVRSRINEGHRSDYGNRDKNDVRKRSRSPDRHARHRRERHDESAHNSARDASDRWRRRTPEREDEEGERKRNYQPTFLRPDDSYGSSLAGKFKRPTTTSQISSSSTWDFDSKQEPSFPRDRTMSRPSGRWKKKPETGPEKSTSSEVDDKKMEELVQDRREVSESESSSNSETEEEEKKESIAIPAKKITEADLNEIGAKIVKSEIMGNEDLAAKLKSQLDEMRRTKELQESQAKESGPTNKRTEETVVLTRTDAAGNVRPLELTTESEHVKGRKKRQKVETHNKEGKRERYFADDDKYDLKEMVRREKMQTAEDNNAMMARLSSKSEHRILAAQLSKCHFCFENPDIAKHLIIAIGLKVYLAVPLHESMTDGHCLIVPMQHCSASTLLDEDVWSEIKIYKKGLTKMFEEMEQDVVFLETCKQLKKQRHMIIECVPLPKEVGDMSPIYFKKAILESDTEWAQNKKLIDTRKKGMRASVPKGLPYFSVEFGLDGGFAHVIEEEELFPHYFGKEILGGMLDLEPQRWRKPRKENFEEHKNKVLRFGEWWEPFDWTKKIDRTNS